MVDKTPHGVIRRIVRRDREDLLDPQRRPSRREALQIKNPIIQD